MMPIGISSALTAVALLEGCFPIFVTVQNKATKARQLSTTCGCSKIHVNLSLESGKLATYQPQRREGVMVALRMEAALESAVDSEVPILTSMTARFGAGHEDASDPR